MATSAPALCKWQGVCLAFSVSPVDTQGLSMCKRTLEVPTAERSSLEWVPPTSAGPCPLLKVVWTLVHTSGAFLGSRLSLRTWKLVYNIVVWSLETKYPPLHYWTAHILNPTSLLEIWLFSSRGGLLSSPFVSPTWVLTNLNNSWRTGSGKSKRACF